MEVRFKTELWNPLTMAHEMATTLFFGSLGLYATYLTNQIYFSDSTELTDTSINLSESNFKDMITYLSFASGVYVGDIGACLAVQPFLGSWQSLGFNILIAIIVPLSTYFHVLPLLLIAVICCDSCQLFSKPQRILVRLGFAPTNISMLFFNFGTVVSHIYFRCLWNTYFCYQFTWVNYGIIRNRFGFLAFPLSLIWIITSASWYVWLARYIVVLKQWYYMDIFGGNVGFRRMVSLNPDDKMMMEKNARMGEGMPPVGDDDVFEDEPKKEK